MRIRIPKFTIVDIVDESGNMVQRVCLEKALFVVSEDDKKGNQDSENPPGYDTMAPAGAE